METNISKAGFIRDRTQAYCQYRNQHHSSNSSSINNHLLDEKPERSHRDEILTSKTEEIENRFSELNSNISSLAELHHQRVNMVSFNDEKTLESNIEAKTALISKAIKSIKTKIGDLAQFDPTRQNIIISNLQKGYYARLRDATISFREMQLQYAQKLKTKLVTEDEDNDGEFESFDDVGFTSEQMAAVVQHQVDLSQRNTELATILNQLGDLRDIYNDLSTLIIEQGTILDRIDNYVENAQAEVQQAVEQVNKAEVHQSSKCFYYYLLLMIILIIILGSVIIVKKANKKKSEGGGGSEDPVNNTVLFDAAAAMLAKLLSK
ncbi:syntaxin 16/TLG2-like protein [Histomonas meleagridis]|uniref:syntaxin 16/TLG2-like protein n=1 Tax=Histomonas meleagridis TaxID=135588 RepID=UPI003559EC39|nr:syntaxin 16/TLG2-like protein [Histomonas meleagridis]KAH0797645.1 syntaxin 16/TLG2-like protein [Histomonas meleagridis]